MTETDLDHWAKTFVADLGPITARVPFDRVVRRHRAALERFLARGLTFTTVAKAVTRAGGERPDGRAYSDKQFATGLRRARVPGPLGPRTPDTRSHDPTSIKWAKEPSAPASLQDPDPHQGLKSAVAALSTDLSDKDPTDEDLRTALQRIRRSDP